MSAEPSKSADALVIGAGPVGLTMALALKRHGLSCRIIDQAEAPTIYSKAQVVHSRTLEIVEDLDVGITMAMLERGKAMRGVNVFAANGERRIAHVVMSELDAPYPYPLSLPQRDTEQILAEALARHGITVERKVRLARFSADADGVSVVLVHENDGGREEESRAAWLLGCDGAHSTVRAGLGMELEGSTYEFRLIQADVHVELPIAIPDDEITAFIHPDGPIGLLPLPGVRRYRMLVFLSGAEVEPTLENFQELMRTRGLPGAVVSDPAWTVAFRIHARLAPRLREGRVFLAGDAAHIHSPAGGQGMNMGMQDAYNLAWKLALVHRGYGQPRLLDSYAAERMPVHRATLAATDVATRRGAEAIRLKNRVAVEVRNQIFGFVAGLGFVQDAITRSLSMLDVGYAKSPIVGESRPEVLQAGVIGDRTSEAPTLTDWLRFGVGPAPGSRAPDAPLDTSDDLGSDPRSLLDLFAGTHHTLLLFDGAATTPEGYANLARIAEAVVARLHSRVRCFVVVPRHDRPAELPQTSAFDVILDVGGLAHKRYGARSECLYLVRPDKHVGFRSQPASEEALMTYLAGIFAL
jgi:2-polyprenyl-6-methoxyphenol hydroxylase-like FAD-dependent oxidoreductase